MQSVGGLRIDAPVVEADGSTYLPLLCDVSGLQTITVKPTAMNSSQVVRQIVVQRRKEKIQLQVVTGIADNQRTSVVRGVSGWEHRHVERNQDPEAEQRIACDSVTRAGLGLLIDSALTFGVKRLWAAFFLSAAMACSSKLDADCGRSLSLQW